MSVRFDGRLDRERLAPWHSAVLELTEWADRSIPLSRLEQLVYLTDLETYLTGGRSLTGLPWVLTAHGPKSAAMRRSLFRLDGPIVVQRMQTESRRGGNWRVTSGPSALDLPRLDENGDRAVSLVAETTVSLPPRRLKAVIDATTPMRFYRLTASMRGHEVSVPLDWAIMTEPRLLSVGPRSTEPRDLEADAAIRQRELHEFDPLVARALGER